MVSAISVSSLSTPVIWSLNGTILSEAVRKALKAATLRLSVNSKVVFKSTPCSFSFFKPTTNSGNVFTANLPLPSAKFNKILRVAVADIEASKPASASFPNNAKVSSIWKLNAFATGPTIGKAVAR